MKKALVFLLIFTIGSVLFAQQRSGQDGLVYEIVYGRSVTITKYTGNATTLNIPERIQGLPVTAIGNSAFLCCDSLTNVTIPSSVRSIGGYAFQSCSSLTSVTIPSSVTAVGLGAFSGCDSLTNVIIPSSVTTIGDWAFYNCNSLTSITVDNRNPSYASIDGVLFDKNIRTIIRYPQGKNQSTYVIPSSVRSVGDYAFDGCNLANVTIPSSVTTIGDWAFFYCGSLTSVTIPSSVTAIGVGAFNSYSLTSLTVNNRNPSYASIDGVLFDKNIRTLIRYPPGGNQSTYVIPSSVTFIGELAFLNCESLISVTLSRRTRVGESAFPETARIIYRD